MSAGRLLKATVLVGLLLGTCAATQAQPSPLAVASSPNLSAVVGTPVRMQLAASGGQPPSTFRLLQAPLPPGLKLDPSTGIISGTPSSAGEFTVPFLLIDSSAPPQQVQFELLIRITAAVDVKWKQPPSVREDGIVGSVVVSNNTSRALQFTVVVLAVNGLNKAYALGYQHFDLRPRAESPVIRFGSSLPFGVYVVHVDAVAEDPAQQTIYRSRLQTPRRLTLQQH